MSMTYAKAVERAKGWCDYYNSGDWDYTWQEDEEVLAVEPEEGSK